MSDENRARQAARFLLGEQGARRPFAPIPAAYAPRTVDEGHPLEALKWLANACAKRGTPLAPGLIIITGSIGTPKPVHAGDTVSAVVDGLGELHVTIE